MTHVSMIAAMTKNRVIGNDNHLPWHLPADLKHFKTMTLGKPVLMGRKTFDSIGQKPLPKRDNFILTRNTTFQAPGCHVIHDLQDIEHNLATMPELMIIGGAQLYTKFLACAHTLYLTEIDATVEGDAFFPVVSPDLWQEQTRVTHPKDDTHSHAFDFVTYVRKTPPAPLLACAR